MKATDQQVQNFVNERVRPGCEQFVALLRNIQLTLAQMGDIAENLNAVNPSTTWVDIRPDGPPHLATVADIITMGAALQAFFRVINGVGTEADSVTIATAIPTIQSLCVRV